MVEDEAEVACGAPCLVFFFVPEGSALPTTAGFAFDGVDFVEVAVSPIDGEVGEVLQLEKERLPSSIFGTARGVEHVDVRPDHEVVAAGLVGSIAWERGVYARDAVSGDVGVGDEGVHFTG